MTDYSHGKVYKLISDITDEVYVGSTCETLSQRFSKHKTPHNRCCSKKMFVEGAKVEIVLLELAPCTKESELKERELYWMETFRAQDVNIINIRKPFITDIRSTRSDGNKLEWQKEYDAEHKLEKAARRKEYYAANSDTINAKRRERYAKKQVLQEQTVPVVPTVKIPIKITLRAAPVDPVDKIVIKVKQLTVVMDSSIEEQFAFGAPK